MKNFEKQLKIAIKNVKFDDKNQMLSNIYFKNQIKDSIQSVKLSLFKKFLILFKIKAFAFIESFKLQKLQYASFLMLVVIFANLALPVFISSTQADFAPYLQSQTDFSISRLKNKSNFRKANLLEGDKVSTTSFSNLKLSEFSDFRTSNDAFFSLDKFTHSSQFVDLQLTTLKGEYWVNFTSDFNSSLNFQLNTPICYVQSKNDSVFYLNVTNSSLYIKNFKNDLVLDCIKFNSNTYNLKAGDSFKISLFDSDVSNSNNLFILKNIDLDKQLRKSTVDSYLTSNQLSLYEINKMLISLKLSNMIEISEFDRFNNQLDIIKLMHNKVINFGLKKDINSFNKHLEKLKLEIIDFRDELNQSSLDDLSKTNLYSFFIKWITLNNDINSKVLELEYLLPLKSDLLEVLFVYYSDIIDVNIIDSYLQILDANIDVINLKYSRNKFSVLKTLYLLRNFIPNEKTDLILEVENQINNFSLDTFGEITTTSVLSFDKDSGINLEISSVDKNLLLDSINF